MNVPNPVQRRDRKIVSDDLLAPCAQEGGTFRDPAPRGTLRQKSRGWLTNVWLAVCLVAICVVIAFALSDAAHAASSTAQAADEWMRCLAWVVVVALAACWIAIRKSRR